MKPVSIAYAKNNLSALLRRVRAGHAVIITDRGVPVAQIVAPPSSRGIPPRLIGLAESGAVRLPDRQPDAAWARGPLPALRRSRGNAAVDALLDERRSGR
jgi:antitoxin (DNA-binding transcriptional repressor) of toxin-antitoxin stability system